MASKRVTIRDVADAAGVSTAAVSYALRGLQVSEETQRRVRRVADDLGYEPHSVARALASGRTGMVGVLGPSLDDLWQQRFAAEAGRALLASDRYALILDAGGDASRQRALAVQLRDQQVDGIIVSPVDPADGFWPDIARELPIVSIGDQLQGAAVAGEVLFDNRSGVTCALEHLRELGHRRIAVLRPPGASTSDRPAETYVRTEAGRLGLEVAVTSSPPGIPDVAAVARELLGAAPRPTAAFCFSDSLAYGVYAAARELGLRIPDDLSVVGYDDHPVSVLLPPPLTTFAWNTPWLVERAVSMVLDARDDPQGRRPPRIEVDPAFRLRQSTAPAPAG